MCIAVCLMSASLITHDVQPCTCLPHDSHMRTAYLTLPLWLASIPLHGCTYTPIILMYDLWRMLRFFSFPHCSSLASLPCLRTVLRNAFRLNTASFLCAVHGSLTPFPLAFYGRPSLTRVYHNVASSLLSHRPSFPLISDLAFPLRTLLGPCTGSPYI